ncbi:MAG: hypothetical protein KJI72_00330 [Patescibacteria group bacterium]|nr:hypothetical protein [Patescibacteria group bacterium]
MEIQKIYIGAWFQRTPLHLSEIYDFLTGKDSPLELDKKKLKKLLQDLQIQELKLVPSDLDYINVSTTKGISFRIYEDGLVRLEKGNTELAQDIEQLRNYYEKKLSPAISYLFILGAPIPKELANIKNIYPYFVVLRNADKEDIYKIIKEHGQKKHFEIRQKTFEVYRGDKLYIINNLSEDLLSIEKFIEENIFIREYKSQLHRYLNLHRIIWERIADIKEKGEIKGRDIGLFKNKMEEYDKTINLIDARINQMDTFVSTRSRVVQDNPSLKPFLEILQFKHETLSDTLNYIKDLWKMTQEYVKSALNIFAELQAKSTEGAVKNLTVVTSMGVGATLIGLFTKKLPSLTFDGFVYFLVVAGIGYAAHRIIALIYARKKYSIKDIKIAKDIK